MDKFFFGHTFINSYFLVINLLMIFIFDHKFSLFDCKLGLPETLLKRILTFLEFFGYKFSLFDRKSGLINEFILNNFYLIFKCLVKLY
jgi:hypothetical protein